jgi:hypothetical protein
MISYAQIESNSIRECERRMLRRFQSRDEGRMKCAHAHVLQSLRRHGPANPAFIKKEAYKSTAAALGIWEILVPLFIPFLKQAIGVLVEHLMKLIDGLQPTDPTIPVKAHQSSTLTALANEAQQRWPQRGSA